ncbi:glycoside hydrolase family 127 protein [Pseudonocardia sp. MH-G8]|uniref:glycoside hydrolase family 127 protein n=1 Tax=Pseudonocardia sp. MH-G8 TaxID=1854588 RepID=UPI000BA08E25|nr:beta-L-arabinofuranosidase domain-containing protein [Pseudonocardia sp. MH-G8]OZM75774.1 hypothetical protein CFP66_44810 [Pseudonocardia sp. MH-G8]
MTGTTARAGARPVAPARGRLRPLAQGEVEITGGFWGQRQEVNATATLEHCQEWMERVGWIGNFRAAVEGRVATDRRGREFSDSDVYKLVEAMAWEVGRTGDPAVDERLRDLVATIAAAQEDDGYLGTKFGRPGQGPRWSDPEWGHELYCIGHLVQAAVARARTSDDTALLDIARRAADHVCEVFGPGGAPGIDGHPEIEPALVELARLSGEQRYLEMAAEFVERRGHQRLADIEFGRAYFQDDVPVREATVLRGHAVRALYLAAGAVDVAVETGDPDLLAAIERQWEATVARRTYLTGGMGSHHQDESFGDDHVLPPDRAYCETCAGVASVMLSWRLLLATGNPRYADLAERTLFNVVATSPAPDGRAFYYVNTLHQRRPGVAAPLDRETPRAGSSLRAPWFSVSCCPTNVARTLASLDTYLATVDDDGLQLHQYADARISTRLPDGRPVGVEVATTYPDGGRVTVRIAETADAPWTLTLRVPSWGAGATVTDGDGRRAAGPGSVSVHRRFAVGEEIQLDLPVGPRFTEPDPRIDAVRGCVAVERGPLVLCVESTDLPDGRHVDDVRVDPDRPPRDDGGVTAAGVLVEQADGEWPYRPSGRPSPAAEPAAIPLAPYHSWATRGPSTMRIWLPTV